MKILWLCNKIIPQVCQRLGIEDGNKEGWLNQLADYLDCLEDVNLCVCAPYLEGKEITYISWGKGSSFYGYQKKVIEPHRYDGSLDSVFQSILKQVKPDVVHIFGSEYPHTLAMVKAFGKPERMVIHIQGLVSFCSLHYFAYLQHSTVSKWTFRDLLRHDNILCQKKKFEKRGKFEKEAICGVKHVMGRTDWDKACTAILNPKIQYHEVQEMMRKPFYEGNWKLEECEKHSIFMSQGGYPIKGLHLALQAVALLKKRYRDIKIYVAGSDILHYNSFSEKIRRSYYGRYIDRLIRELKLDGHVLFTGSLDAEEMKRRYLSSHVFLSASSIENSPNSIGEAMLLGVPIVASAVGGVSSLIRHAENGMLYQADAFYMAAYYIKEIFDNDEQAMMLSAKERNYADGLYDRGKILDQVIGVYRDMEKMV